MTADVSGSSASGAPHMAAKRSGDGPLDERRPFMRPIPDSSVGSVRKVAKLDGGTHVVAARRPGGTWYRLYERTRFTRQNAALLREAGVSEVVLRRGLGYASFPLGWLSSRGI